jgi:hypothetical protein
MPRSTSARILVALLAGWVQWTFADPTGARSQAMYGVAAVAAPTLANCHGPAAIGGQAADGAEPVAHAGHDGHEAHTSLGAPVAHAGHDASPNGAHVDHGAPGASHAASADHGPAESTPPAHHHGCALCPLACCAGVVLPVTAARTATTVAIVATAPTAPWPPLVRDATGAIHRLPFATGPPTAG